MRAKTPHTVKRVVEGFEWHINIVWINDDASIRVASFVQKIFSIDGDVAFVGLESGGDIVELVELVEIVKTSNV